MTATTANVPATHTAQATKLDKATRKTFLKADGKHGRMMFVEVPARRGHHEPTITVRCEVVAVNGFMVKGMLHGEITVKLDKAALRTFKAQAASAVRRELDGNTLRVAYCR